MSSSARDSAVGLRARLDERRDDPGLSGLSAELFAVAEVLGADSGLRSALVDAGQPAARRVSLARDVFGAEVSVLTADVLADVVGQRWSSSDDLVDAVEELAAQAAFMVAAAQDRLGLVEQELFGFSQAVGQSAPLQMALTDPAVGAEQKRGLVDSLLTGRSTAETAEVLRYSMAHLRGRRVAAVLDALIDLAGEQRDRSVAEVRVARPLAPGQATRLAAALSRVHGRDVNLNVVVDPDVIGGISVRIGNQVTDATVATRLAQARRALVG